MTKNAEMRHLKCNILAFWGNAEIRHLRYRSFGILGQNPRMPKEASLGILRNAKFGIWECRNRHLARCPLLHLKCRSAIFSDAARKRLDRHSQNANICRSGMAILDLPRMPQINAHIWHLQDETFRRFIGQPVHYRNGTHERQNVEFTKGGFPTFL